ncbi:hypothetical protein C8Q74DRAFT_1367957 [Fomes fomentarius]|nr:hypothetical protein C8Q74DRAFT_1367957 [Fomes fomentarius]
MASVVVVFKGTDNPPLERTGYIVVFKPHVSKADVDKYADEVAANGGEVGHRYGTVLNGFSATIPDSYLLTLQSFQGDIVDYIGASFVPNLDPSPSPLLPPPHITSSLALSSEELPNPDAAPLL